MTYTVTIARLMNCKEKQIAAVIQLLEDGNTIPFIARYRKEATGSLDEEALRNIQEHLDRLKALDERRATILASIESQEKLTPELRSQIEAADTLTELEDLYLPYKPRRRTRASIAREQGLEPLAQQIVAQPRTLQILEQFARPFISDEIPDVEAVLSGARDIVAEDISTHARIRQIVRGKAMKYGTLRSTKIKSAEDEREVYHTYYAFEKRVSSVQPYQTLAINRGENEKVLRVHLDIAERDWRQAIEEFFRPDSRSPLVDQLEMAITDSASRLLLPAIERDVRRELTEKAEIHAIQVFATNLRGLLEQPPLPGHTILGIDPGFRTGCKVAIIDPSGRVLATDAIYPHPPQKRYQKSLETLRNLVKKYAVTLIAIGNGTASRETEHLVAELTRDNEDVHYLMVSEAGASVYSASPLAKDELPDLDVTLRGAVSIARRVQDPLAELVKIEPRSIGVGLYQHDVDQKQLDSTLDGVVESVVNRVGVDVNTASPALLTRVAGIGPRLAEKIIAHRDIGGRFNNRQELLKVSGLGPKAFEQAAGFLRIRDGDNPLDASAIHPESYTVARSVLKHARIQPDTPLSEKESALTPLKNNLKNLAQELQTGIPTLSDILEQLLRPGRDPREEVPPPVLRRDVLSMEDLQIGMRLKGTVRNVVDFGAFIDIGVKQDGLLHRSKIPRGTTVQVGDVLDIEILSIEIERGRIGLGLPQA